MSGAGAVRAGPAAFAVALAAGAAALAWICVGQSAAAWFADEAPQTALAFDAAAPEPLYDRAQAALAGARGDADFAAAAREASAALRAAPLDAGPLRILAIAAELRGDMTRARRLMRLCSQRTSRDTLSQVWLFSDALNRRDYAEASLHADALLRRVPELEPRLVPAMIGAMAEPGGLDPVVARLAEDPEWRPGFLRVLAGQGRDAGLARTVFARLAATGAPPTAREAAPLIERLVVDRDYGGARAEWTRFAPDVAADGGVYDGDFRGLPGPPPFNWRLTAQGEAVAELAAAPDGAGALHARAPATADSGLAEQLLTLAPGAWRLTGLARVEPGPAGAVFSWRLSCADPSGADLAEAQIAADTPGWRAVSATFTVPPAGCPAQWLRLGGLAHDGFDSAEGWFRALRLQPVAAAISPDGRSG